MSQIDEFESAFKSADKPVFKFAPTTINQALLILDTDEQTAGVFIERANSYLDGIEATPDAIKVDMISSDQFSSVSELLELIKQKSPDLICTYRNLRAPATEYPYSLGVYIDVLTQATDIPILLLPRPEWLNESNEYPSRPDSVLAITDHLAGDSFLVNFAVRFVTPNGKLTLVHVEDQQTFDRYIATIGKIPDLDTDLARSAIMTQLLKEPTDYIESCKQGIAEAQLPIEVDSVVTSGHRLTDYRTLLLERQVDLLVMNTKDEDQLAMHGLAYPLSVEFRKTPMLLI